MKRKKVSELYGIIGLGRFGFALAQTLAESGKEVLVVDNDEQKIHEAVAFTDNAFKVEALTAENLREIGVQNCDTVIVCIGEKIDVSILATLTVIKMGVKRVISKAISAEQGCVLETLGAEVVYPERDMAIRVAKKLIGPRILEYISLSENVDISEIELTEKVSGTTVKELDLRRSFGLNIIALRKNERLDTDIDPSMKLLSGDTLIVVGKSDNIQRFEEYLEI